MVFKEKRTRARRPRYFALLALYPSEGFSYCKNKTSAHAAVGEVRALIKIVPSGHKFNIRPIDELCSSPWTHPVSIRAYTTYYVPAIWEERPRSRFVDPRSLKREAPIYEPEHHTTAAICCPHSPNHLPTPQHFFPLLNGLNVWTPSDAEFTCADWHIRGANQAIHQECDECPSLYTGDTLDMWPALLLLIQGF